MGDGSFHQRLGDALTDSAERWWRDHHGEAAEIGEALWERAADDLARGDAMTAAMEIAQEMDLEEWRAYRDGTTERLQDTARERVQLYRLLGSLSAGVARAIGRAILQL